MVTDAWTDIVTAQELRPRCEWGPDTVGYEGGHRGHQCQSPAEWAFVWREKCVHGSDIPPPWDLLFCDKHKVQILDLMHTSGMVCVGCLCPILTWAHVLTRVTRL